MAPKKPLLDPRISNSHVGMMVTRGQIETLGHGDLKKQMMLDNSRNILCFGSSEKHGVEGNPLTADQKRIAHQGLWGDTFKLCMLQDIGATDRTTDWADYVFSRIKANNMPEPTDLYAGSRREARWYEAHFTSLKGEPTYRRGQFDVWENSETGKRIHILDRQVTGISSSEVRSLIEQRDPAWKSMVAARLWDFYEWEYPPHLRVAIQIESRTSSGIPDEDFPSPESVPVGTKAIYTTKPDQVFILRDDGKWRLRTEAESRKSLGD
jgi:hypothetical protein